MDMNLFDLLANLHWDVLLKVIGIDLVLGLDNAIVIALACAALAPELRNKAVVIGTAGAILARILFLFIGFWLVSLPFVHLLAGAYLVYLGYSMVAKNNQEEDTTNVAAKSTMWGAAITIVTADLLMSLDNVVALVGAASGTGEHAFGYTVFGILLSIPIIIFASKGLLKLLDKFPIIVWAGAALIAWVGAEMLLKEPVILQMFEGNHTKLTVATMLITLVVMFRAWLKTLGMRLTNKTA